jgi:hypothetical protein
MTPTPTLDIANISDEVRDEVIRATSLFGPHNSPHESLGVIEEEFEEFKQQVFKYNLAKGRDTRPEMRKELIQVAAMAVRAIYDLKLEKENW